MHSSLQGSQYQGALTSQTQPQFTQGAMQGPSSHFNTPSQGIVGQQKQFATQGYGQGPPQNFGTTTQQLGSQRVAGMQQGGWQQQGPVYSSGLAPQQQQQQQQQAQFGMGPQHPQFARPSEHGAGMDAQQQQGQQGMGGGMLGTGLGSGGQQHQPGQFGGQAARIAAASRFAGRQSGELSYWQPCVCGMDLCLRWSWSQHRCCLGSAEAGVAHHRHALAGWVISGGPSVRLLVATRQKLPCFWQPAACTALGEGSHG